ncbi:FAD-dependent oxidoreductase [Nannocystis radixulma]|uniref:NAD(P)/FAD-dependent oxidoreductase n=1 Tax=Nannocystis radixulma TaxID=2995305 RepID=A0ABT5AWN5_9BACT|nr:NAD(P)/FAD-dependent oxidoreductase [Nannocystis radixulma]MDC0666236.1 NAD(P)/FAD-dependent oxidoreductase [Nannocystis radixulma]
MTNSNGLAGAPRSRVRRALVVGGGVAGPTLAMFLRRLGVATTVLEARTSERGDVGAFLGLAPNGLQVLAELGLAEAIAGRGAACQGMRFENARGRCIGVIDHRDHVQRFGAQMVMIRRAALHTALIEAAAERGAECRFGARVVAVDERPNEVVARLESGEELAADVLLGCDGIRSQVRALTLPDAPAPAYTGLCDVGGFARCPEAPLEPGWTVMTFGRRAFFGAFAAPGGEVWWFHNNGARAAMQAIDPEQQRASILALHRDDSPWIADVVRATPTLLGPWVLHDIMTMPRWHAGRVCLLGDAAHATSPSAGQGASLALEDALVLSRCLRDADAPQAAFARFEAERRGRVEAIVRQARKNGDGKAPAGPVAAWFRDRMLPLFLRLGAKAQAEAFAHRVEWAAPGT